MRDVDEAGGVDMPRILAPRPNGYIDAVCDDFLNLDYGGAHRDDFSLMTLRTVILLLAALLIGSNLFWLFRSLDAGVTDAYQVQSDTEASTETFAALATALLEARDAPVTAEPAVGLLQRASPSGPEPFVKDNAGTDPDLVVGDGVALGLDAQGHVTRTIALP